MEWATRNRQPSSNSYGEREREEDRARGAESHSLLRVSLPPRRDRRALHHTHAHHPPRNSQAHRRHRNFRGRKKSRSEIRRSKSFRCRGAPPSSPSPNPGESPLNFPQSAAALAARRRLRPSQPVAAAADLHPREGCVSLLALLPRPNRHRVAFSGPRGRGGSFSGNPPLVGRRRAPLPRRPRVILVLGRRGGGDPPGRGSIPLLSVAILLGQEDQSTKAHEEFFFSQILLGVQLNPHARR
ncbi:hypothetical protein U9M48_032714 [Paspalum notatum var. saurae]|uniref:Uncharacterized protein n=1 Tax=Paspalum notatum var. saurae TaxID=547442 RepID=A0AAQ3U8J2_PASNO